MFITIAVKALHILNYDPQCLGERPDLACMNLSLVIDSYALHEYMLCDFQRNLCHISNTTNCGSRSKISAKVNQKLILRFILRIVWQYLLFVCDRFVFKEKQISAGRTPSLLEVSIKRKIQFKNHDIKLS